MTNKPKKFYLILGFLIIGISIIIEYIMNLIFHQRDLIGGLVYAISWGLIFFIIFSVLDRFWIQKKRKLSKF